MTRRLVMMVVAGLVLALALVGPADARARHARPSAPRAVVATTVSKGGAVLVSWKAPKHRGSSAVEAYAIAYAPASHPNRRSSVVVGSDQRSVVLQGLDHQQSYVVRVAAYNRWGRGPWARAHIGPAKHVEALFAVDEDAHTLVRFDLADKAGPRTLLSGVSDVSDLEVDASGNVYLAAGGTVTEVAATGASSVVGAGSAVETDAAGDVYLGGASGVVRVSPDGTRTTITTSDEGGNLAVDHQGVVTLSAIGFDTTLTTYAPGAQPVVRTLRGLRGGQILSGGAGTVYDNANSAGAARFGYWVRVAAGSSDTVTLGTRSAEYGATVAADDSFYLAESGSFCASLSEDMGTCTPNREVTSIARYAADGHLLSDVPTSGFKVRRFDGIEIATDSKGVVYAADRGVGDKPGLVSVPAAGGAGERIADGTFSLLAVG